MSRILMILGLVTTAALTGCATATHSDDRTEASAPRTYLPAASAALAFDPPLIAGLPLPSLSREGRALEAFAGYEDQVTTFSYVHQKDEIRIRTEGGDLRRQAYTDRTSVTTR